MPDVGSQVLDVALGLLFVYLVFSLVCTALQELVALVLSWRAEHLERGLRRLLIGPSADKVDTAPDTAPEKGSPAALLADLLANPRITELLPQRRKLRKARSVPAYISSSTFSLALIDTIVPPSTKGQPSRDLILRAEEAIAALPESDVRRELSAMVASAGKDLGKLRGEIESWFDETMTRVSGWYKRKAQTWLLVFGFLVAAIGNVDTMHVVDRLWTDPTTRAAVVAQAQKASAAEDTKALEEVVSTYSGIKSLQLPVGWTTPQADAPDDARAFPDSIDLMKVIGIILTAFALSFGAPFWFEALSKLGRLRATAKPDGASPKTAET